MLTVTNATNKPPGPRNEAGTRAPHGWELVPAGQLVGQRSSVVDPPERFDDAA
jgi:hypothetical protein